MFLSVLVGCAHAPMPSLAAPPPVEVVDAQGTNDLDAASVRAVLRDAEVSLAGCNEQGVRGEMLCGFDTFRDGVTDGYSCRWNTAAAELADADYSVVACVHSTLSALIWPSPLGRSRGPFVLRFRG